MEQGLQVHGVALQHTVSALACEHSRQFLAQQACMVDRRTNTYKSVSLQIGPCPERGTTVEPPLPQVRARGYAMSLLP